MRIVALVIVLFVGAPTFAEAQPRGGPAGVQQRREAIKKKIRAMRAYTLTEELSLDEKTAAKLFPVLAKWDDVTDKLIQQRLDIQRRMAAAEAGDPKMLDRVIDEAVANQRALWDLEDKRLAELRKILTPQQTARLIVVLPAFERKVRNQLRRAGARRGARAQRDGDLE